MIKLADAKATGIWHFTAKDQLSYADAINSLLDRLGLNSSLVDQTTSVDIGLPQKSHKITVLDAVNCVMFLIKLYTSEEVLERIAYHICIKRVRIGIDLTIQ